ncbi:serine/threonine protein kinase [Altericista sp. CCNU0014]|uniref:serine/threonine protein kinase n=1 Tax=Altericista sp. CCNU0014 TaxID=3082949 RepID=UPI0038508D07
MQSKTFGKTPGELFGDRYQIEQQLGKRAGRYTLLARDLQTNAQVVIKRLSFGEDFAWEDLKLFEREAATLKDLYHPAIPRYLDYFDLDLPSGKGVALVQTYIPAQSLEAHVKAGRTFSEAELVELATALLEILRYLHERAPAVIHRDIKPSNILLGDSFAPRVRTGNSVGSVYLVDFGSVQAAQTGGTKTVVGTYGYMPPEQFGDRAVPASDLYSLGATLVYLATGQHPADLPQIDQQIQFEESAHLSVGIDQWLKKMIQPSLNRRFSSAQEALATLQQRDKQQEALVLQPANSKVMFAKTSESLEILLPPAASTAAGTIGLVFMGAFAIAWNSFIVTWTGFAFMIPSPIKLVFILFSLPFWAVGLSMAGGVLFGLFGRVRIKLTSEQIRQDCELFGFTYSVPPPSLREDITKLELTKTFFKKDSDGDRIEVKPQLLIWAGTRKYGFFGGSTLTQPELEWLAQELSSWLSLPITRE